MKGLKVKPEDLVRIVREGLGDLFDRGVRDVLPRPRVNKGERKAGDARGDSRHIMESDFA